MAYSYKGAITFGLVYIPITLSLCIKEHDIGFNMLERKTKSRIKYKKTCVSCNNKEVKNEDIVKGYQYEKGKYVIFTDEDFEKIKTPKDKNITIEQFVNLDEVDPIYFDKAYYVTPSGADKAYQVLLKAMESERKAGIAKTVLGTKETLILLRVRNGTMLINTLYFHNEVQAAPAVAKIKLAKQELDLAKNLITQMTKSFEPEKFKDEYHLRLQKAIKRKIAGNDIVEAKQDQSEVQIINLMEALQKSLKTEKPKRKAQ
ncbi:MAG: Ku protein [Clostridia bacterium]|nr:Ku protein [Clostridia bacterium]